MHVYLHNEAIVRGDCGVCRDLPATWTISGNIPFVGAVKTDICPGCLKVLDIPAWANAAEKRIMGSLEQTIREATGE